MGKHNKRVKTFAGDFELGSLRTEFERVRSVWGERRGVWMALDFEGWERDHTVITEFGWSVVRWDKEEEAVDGEVKLKEVREEGHWTVKEYDSYRNGTYVRDNRDVSPRVLLNGCVDWCLLQRYDFGKTEKLTKAVFKKRIGDMISGYAAEGPLYLVFHDRYGDIK